MCEKSERCQVVPPVYTALLQLVPECFTAVVNVTAILVVRSQLSGCSKAQHQVNIIIYT